MRDPRYINRSIVKGEVNKLLNTMDYQDLIAILEKDFKVMSPLKNIDPIKVKAIFSDLRFFYNEKVKFDVIQIK